MKISTVLFSTAVLASFASTIIGFNGLANAAENAACGPRNEIIASLKTKYHEEPLMAGITNKNLLMEVFGTADGTTWTAAISGPDGKMCLVFAGPNYATVPVEPAGDGISEKVPGTSG